MDLSSAPRPDAKPAASTEPKADGPTAFAGGLKLSRDAFYRALFDNPDLACFVVNVMGDGSFRFADANAAGDMFTAIPWQQVPGHAPRDCLIPEVAEYLEGHLRSCVETGLPRGYERAIDLPRGRTAWTTNLTPVADRHGRVRHVIGLSRLIPPALHVSGADARNAALIESLRQAAPGLVYLFDLRLRRFRFVAGQKSRPLGYQPFELEEMLDPVGRLFHADDRGRVETHFKRLVRLDDREIATFECRMLNRDGQFLHFSHRHMAFSRHDDGSTALVFGIANDVTDQQRMREEVHGLSERLITVALDERRRIARDLHDGTGQHIVAAEMALARIQTTSADAVRDNRQARELKQSLGEVMNFLQEAESDIRILSYLMHPPDVLNWGLATAVRTYAAGFGRRAGIAVELRIDDDADSLPQRIAVPLLRCCQEALTNVYRHARARNILVALAAGADRVTLTIADDGVGLDEIDMIFAAGKGVGLPGIRERLARLGGSLELRNDGGARLDVEVPLDPAAAGCAP